MQSVRSCSVCRTKASKPELCRFVRALDGEICFDEQGELPHRGAWLCPRRECMSKAFQKRLLFRGEKTLPVNADVMSDHVRSRIRKSTLSRFGVLRRMGAIEVGRDAVKRLMLDGKAHAVILAKDLSARSVGEVREKADATSPELLHMSPFLMDEIGQSIGRKKTGVVGLLKSRITDEILLQIKKLSNLEQ